jgi:hypothetical protein
VKRITLLLILITFILSACGKNNIDIEFEKVDYMDASHWFEKEFHSVEPGGTGIFTEGDKTFAFVAVSPDEAVEFISVGDAADGRIDINYRIIKVPPSNKQMNIELISFMKIEPPIRFKKYN